MTAGGRGSTAYGWSPAQSFLKGIKGSFISETTKHHRAWFISAHTRSWEGVAAVNSLTGWHIVEYSPKLFISCSLPLPFWGVKRNPTPVSFFFPHPCILLHIVWRSVFQNRITQSCVCLIVKSIIDTDSQITNLWDAWCYPEQTEEVCVQCNGQLEVHHILTNLVWQWIAKWMKSSTYKTLSLEQRKEVEMEGNVKKKETDCHILLVPNSCLINYHSAILFHIAFIYDNFKHRSREDPEDVCPRIIIWYYKTAINPSHSPGCKSNSLLFAHYSKNFLNDHNVS